jgi:hypothetical protein
MKRLNKILSRGVKGLVRFFSGSYIPPTVIMQKGDNEANQPKYSVKRVGIFMDDLAYTGRRGIYEITDEQTKKKYLGVSGIGVAEKGVHHTGRASIEFDER